MPTPLSAQSTAARPVRNLVGEILRLPLGASIGSGYVRDVVETALGAVFVACLVLAALLLPCALIDVVAGTNLLSAVVVALLAALLGAGMLSVVVILQRRYSDDTSRRRSSDETARKQGAADRDDEKGGRRR